MRGRILMFILAYVLWCLLSWIPDTQHLLVGIVVAAIVTAVMGSLFQSRPHIMFHPKRYIYFVFWYLPVFFWELLKANIDVAYRVLCPIPPIEPGIVRLKTKLKSDMGLTCLANSITLTPGTLTVDIDAPDGILYIHWINVKGTDTETVIREIGGKFEPILMKIFEEDEGTVKQ